MHKIKTVIAMVLASSFLVAGVASAADATAPAAPAKHKVIKKHFVKKHYVKHVKHMKKAPAKKAAPAM